METRFLIWGSQVRILSGTPRESGLKPIRSKSTLLKNRHCIGTKKVSA